MTKHGIITYCKPNRYLTTALVVLLSVTGYRFSFAQLNTLSTVPEKKETRNGNKQFEKGVYADAEASYKKALDKKNNMPEATFNLGDAVYEQKRYDEAIKQFQLSAQTNPDKGVKAKAYHNLGNTFMQQNKWQEAVNSFKEALKNNPKDAETKYNLAYANERLREQKQNDQNKDNKDNKDQKDKKDDKKDQQDNKDQNKKDQDKDQQAKNNENKDKKDQQGKGQQQPKLSKEEAEKMLQALQGEEQKTNQKMQQKQVKVVNVKIEKDW
ncbi:MAG TPA: tetratricopeptide repeat protein [Chitinophagales bacterium]|nr:tetratricopeptide repeat protein [Chitinophagales bacterium]